jgi:hypothetical protein
MLERIAGPLAGLLGSRSARLRRTPFYRAHPYEHALPIADCDARGAVDPERRVFFNRVPKAANTSVTRRLAALRLGDDVSHHDARRAFIRPSALSAAQVAELPGYFKFTVVRNPYARVLSAYLNKIVGGKKLGYMGRSRGDAAPPSFREFLDYLERSGLHANAHWTPQTGLMLLPLAQLDFVGRVERLHEDLPFVLARVAPERPAPPPEAPRRTRAEADFARHYDADCAAAVRRLYRGDFAAFGYSEAIEEALSAG